ncbi:hypothetical protein DFAR_3360015 [Desulfarculales bacterium]
MGFGHNWSGPQHKLYMQDVTCQQGSSPERMHIDVLVRYRKDLPRKKMFYLPSVPRLT